MISWHYTESLIAVRGRICGVLNEKVGIYKRTADSIKLRLSTRNQISDVTNIINVSVLLEFSSRELTHLISCNLVWYSSYRSYNVPPKG